jgi:hypothetical protein
LSCGAYSESGDPEQYVSAALSRRRRRHVPGDRGGDHAKR